MEKGEMFHFRAQGADAPIEKTVYWVLKDFDPHSVLQEYLGTLQKGMHYFPGSFTAWLGYGRYIKPVEPIPTSVWYIGTYAHPQSIRYDAQGDFISEGEIKQA